MHVAFCATVDCECDKDGKWRVRRPLSCSNIPEGVRRVLKPLGLDFGIRWTMLLSPEVLEDDEAVDSLISMERAELGTHLHSEFVEPDAKRDCLRTDTPQSALPAELEFRKLENLTARFIQKTGNRPRSFRAGRFGYSGRTWEYLEKLGYRVDSSVTPWWRQRFEEGEGHDHWGLRPEPFWAVGPQGRGGGGVLEIPVTIGNPKLLGAPDAMIRVAARSSRLRRGAERIFSGKKVTWLRPVRSSADEMFELAVAVVENWRGKGPPILNMMFHSNELKAGMSPYCASEADVDRLRKQIEELVERLVKRYEIQFGTLSEVKERWVSAAAQGT